MRVLVLATGVADLSPAAAGAEVAGAWARLGHQVAVVPMAAGGPGLAAAVADMPHVAVVAAGAGPSSEQAGAEIAAALACGATTVLLDLTAACPGDAGDGLLAALGRPELEIVGVVRPEELDATLLGVRGVAARRAYGSGTPDVGAALEGDAALTRLATSLGVPEPPPGAGAGDGMGLAVAVLGGTFRAGPQAIAALVGLDRSLAAADLVVVVTDALDFGGAGVTETQAAATWAAEALVPCVAIAGTVHFSGRELRTFGVESAYASEGDLAACAARVARTWNW
jgi:glycerate kinase